MWMQASLDGSRTLSCASCGEGLRSRPTYDGDEDEWGRLACVRRRCCKQRVKNHQSGLAAFRLQSSSATFSEIQRKYRRDWVRSSAVQVRDGMVAELRRLLRIAREAGDYDAGRKAIDDELLLLERFGLITEHIMVGCNNRRVICISLTLTAVGGNVDLSLTLIPRYPDGTTEELSVGELRDLEG